MPCPICGKYRVDVVAQPLVEASLSAIFAPHDAPGPRLHSVSWGTKNGSVIEELVAALARHDGENPFRAELLLVGLPVVICADHEMEHKSERARQAWPWTAERRCVDGVPIYVLPYPQFQDVILPIAGQENSFRAALAAAGGSR